MKNKEPKKKFIAKSIFMTHVRRIGWIRTALGGGLMYISFLEFIFLHLTVITILYRWMLVPSFKLKNLKVKDYILLDRSTISGMRSFDKLNCDFCGYANGTACLWNAQIDEMASSGLRGGNILLKLIAGIYSLSLGVFLFFQFIFSKILYLVIASFLGLHWCKTKELKKELKEKNYAADCPVLIKSLVRCAKIYAQSLAHNLEQIESSWCPLKHLEREESTASEHHKNFYDRDKLNEVIEVLATEGTVSPKKPRY
jgi:hypothetical protein